MVEESCRLLTFFDRCRRWRSPLAAIVFADEFSSDSSSIFVSAAAAAIVEEANVEDVDEEEKAIAEFESVSDDNAEVEVAEGD